MKKTSKLLSAIFTLILAFMLSSCGSDHSDSGIEKWSNGTVESVVLENGLLCTVFDTHRAGGVDCNWEDFEIQSTDEIQNSILTTSSGRLEFGLVEDDRMCVVLDGTFSGGIDCYYF